MATMMSIKINQRASGSRGFKSCYNPDNLDNLDNLI